MNKRNKIIYWIATIWLSFGMAANGIMQLFNVKTWADKAVHLGYPTYFMMILGAAKILGVAALLMPKFVLLKEWAYAGFFFTMLGALISHIVLRDPFSETAPSIFLLILIGTSWYFRPADRKIIAVNQ